MKPVRAPDELVCSIAVGAVTTRSGRVWWRCPTPGPYTLSLEGPAGTRRVRAPVLATHAEADFTAAFTYPDECPGEPDLRPDTRYVATLWDAGGALIGAARFVTAPAAAPAAWSFGFASCHQPFAADGSVAPQAASMLAAAHAALDAHDTRLLLLVGDQIYADAPPALSLVGSDGRAPDFASEAEVRARYHQRYRQAWAVPGFAELQARQATACMPDDHDILNNWGSLPEHAEPAYQRLAAGALAACFDYQMARSLPPGPRAHFGHGFVYANAGFFLLDNRSERRRADDTGRIVSAEQLRALQTFLQQTGALDVVFVVIPVPLIHIPDWLTTFCERLGVGQGELDDRWSAAPFVACRDELLACLADAAASPTRRIVLLSGDIHSGWAATLHERTPPPGRPAAALVQLVSSALTNSVEGGLAAAASDALLAISGPRLASLPGWRVEPLQGPPGGDNPTRDLNLGVVDVLGRDGAAAPQIRFRLYSHGKQNQPRVVFDSGPI